ncbi:MAG: glycosyltransferase family 4 protein [Hyphomicrobiaceae bacterium]
MRIAFHAPLNAPERGKPSGDRLIGRMLMRALIAGGHEVALATPFRSYDKAGDDGRQQRIATLGQRLADRLTRRLAAGPKAERPHLWLTYHLYHKAPDHIGPRVAAALGIPYVVAEASVSERQATGPWRAGHLASIEALGAADMVLGLNGKDRAGVLPHLRGADRYRQIRPFIDTGPYRAAAKGRREARRRLGARTGLGENPILVAVGMMRAGAKLASYRLLADALSRLARGDWGLVIVGGGPEEGAVRAAFAGLGDRIAFLGEMTGEALAQIYAGADLLVWPAIDEAIGMVFIEAAAAGLAVVGARGQGVPDVVEHGAGGLLADYGDAADFARSIEALLEDPDRRQTMGATGARLALERHDLGSEGARFCRLIEAVVAEHGTADAGRGQCGGPP